MLLIEETGSTNADLIARIAAQEPLPEGEWLVARRQSAGRGRLGRVWTSTTGNFHGSTTVALRAGDPPAQTLALATALAVHQAISAVAPALSPRLMLKWPNDLLVDGAKLAGILLERSGGHVVVGCGVNLAWAPEVSGRATTALAALGHPVDLPLFADALANSFAATLARWRATALASLIAAWEARAHPRGTALTISDGPNAGLTGRFDGLEEDGRLRVRRADGETIIVGSGEMALV